MIEINNNEQEVRNSAEKFRMAIESCKKDLGAPFFNFPNGSCGATTILLGTYLCEKGFGEFHYTCGEYGSRADGTWSSHAWLELNDLIVDITADQFPEISETILVTNESTWHKKLNGIREHIADFRGHADGSFRSYNHMYQRIVAEIVK